MFNDRLFHILENIYISKFDNKNILLSLNDLLSCKSFDIHKESGRKNSFISSFNHPAEMMRNFEFYRYCLKNLVLEMAEAGIYFAWIKHISISDLVLN